ncbi:hypothetical protein Tco_0910276 [Tanacetum coccineum]|uniref:Integrase, catalytic region, zinc finger, CCHC-type, peptidase aspartic, catalytic n=1 Tax=Tanacetum coccineum TaxID=301880 RepID=A0ABQ5CVR2_9ASTR
MGTPTQVCVWSCPNFSAPAGRPFRYGTNALSKFSPDTQLVLYPLRDKLTIGDKSLDLSAFKLSCLFFSLLSSGSFSCWRSYGAQLRLHILKNRENGRMILNSVQNGPLIWPTVTDTDGTTRTKKYKELSAIEKIQADCDCKTTNIVLQGLPPDVYAIVNHHRVAKEIWDKVKLLMQGTKLSLQEKECKLYDDFDKFTFVKGETLYQYY